MADENRRAGDWQRKDLRQNANDLVEDPNPKKWHQQTFWIVFFLLVFILVNGLLNIHAHKFDIKSEFFCHDINGFCIQTLVDGHEQAQGHTS